VSRPLVPALALVAALAVAALVLALSGGDDPPPAGPAARAAAPALPAPDAPLPAEPRALAAALVDTTAALHGAVDAWRRAGGPGRPGVPRDVELLALHHQRLHRLLSRRPALARAVLARLPARLRARTRDLVLAPRELGQIRSVRAPGPVPEVRTGPAEPADRLRALYRRAQRRFGVGWPLLAAVNHVESAFGRLRNRSISGAQGPMQFMPATWAAYGLGGDVQDPGDAILGAANYLHASGAPGDERSALHAYNPSDDYVRAVSRYARRIRADERLFYVLYAWQVYWDGRRLTGP